MSQNSITAAGLVIAFLIFVTVRGELPAYFGTLGLGPVPEKSPTTQTGFGFASSYFPSTGVNTGSNGSVKVGISLPTIGINLGGGLV